VSLIPLARSAWRKRSAQWNGLLAAGVSPGKCVLGNRSFIVENGFAGAGQGQKMYPVFGDLRYGTVIVFVSSCLIVTRFDWRHPGPSDQRGTTW